DEGHAVLGEKFLGLEARAAPGLPIDAQRGRRHQLVTRLWHFVHHCQMRFGTGSPSRTSGDSLWCGSMPSRASTSSIWRACCAECHAERSRNQCNDCSPWKVRTTSSVTGLVRAFHHRASPSRIEPPYAAMSLPVASDAAGDCIELTIQSGSLPSTASRND